MKFILRLLIVVFLLESTWAAAAQYCRHELGLVNQHFGHHAHEHQDKAQFDNSKIVIKADSQNAPNIDSDCSYCHLGAMKSMLPLAVMLPLSSEPLSALELLQTYPFITPHQPERPNWRPAA
jgi:hypothetical protein